MNPEILGMNPKLFFYLRQNKYFGFERYPLYRKSVVLLNSNSREPFPHSGCRGLWIGRRLLLGGAFWQGLMMSGEGSSSFSALAKANKSGIEEVFKTVDWPEQFPFKKEDFEQFDESSDQFFLFLSEICHTYQRSCNLCPY